MYNKALGQKKKLDKNDKLTVTCGRSSTLSLIRSNSPDAMGNWW